MAGINDFVTLINTLATVPGAVDSAIKRGIKKGAVIAMGRAKEKLGTYQGASGPYVAWANLKPETVRRKHLSKTGSGKITRAGKAYLKKHGSWGAGGNDDAPLVDTGHLRQAITTDFSELDSRGVAYIGVAAGSKKAGKGSPSAYAAKHEFGYAAKNIPPRPYLRPALEESKPAIRKEILQALLQEMRKY
ncbi:hypothetical protein [Paenibacillus elgii]|uniref:hypothetical protein n=1 Tax=Paenibacillus elgii TaxID=189691 RepID=UPI000248D98D|nr:hypothetical protein [Paenibacillus elgii]